MVKIVCFPLGLEHHIMTYDTRSSPEIWEGEYFVGGKNSMENLICAILAAFSEGEELLTI